MYKIKIISSSVREGRKGPFVAKWTEKQVVKNGNFSVEVIDLGEIDLPLSTEPNHPRARKYEYEQTKKWSRIIEEADAFIFVVAEYNHSFPAPLKNALDCLAQEWEYKPAGIVSYGGVSGGTRSAHDLVGALATMKIVPLLEAVNFPFFAQYFNDDTGEFEPGEISEKAAVTMLKELTLWTKGLKVIREEKAKG